MTHPLYEFTMLGFEALTVMNKRLAKIGLGGAQSTAEIQLMFAEKRAASAEAMATMMLGGTPLATIRRFREHVAANDARLSI